MINSLSEFLQEIEKLSPKNQIFYRGHHDCSYVLLPGIYREGKLIENEESIYRDVITKSPDDFRGKNTLESLTLLQHYGAPTRVLDITENPLVALFFACNDKFEEDGEVVVFDIPDSSVCHFNSDRVTILSNLAKCEKEFNYNSGMVPFFRNNIKELETKRQNFEPSEYIGGFFYENIFEFLENQSEEISNDIALTEFSVELFEELLSKYQLIYNNKKGELDKKESKIFRNNFIDLLQRILQIGVRKSIESVNQNFFGKLLHNIHEDKSYFDAIIDPEDVCKVLAVKPKLDNPRIVRQHGAFLIFGIDQIQFVGFEDYKPMAKLNEEWTMCGEGKESRILISSNAKTKILGELSSIGINEATLFPEIDKIAKLTKKKYS